MESAREFMNKSTIHGLNHIASSKSPVLKGAWSILVLASFSYAALIIKSSFISWKESPVVTSSQTLHISNVKFPKITVCPPEQTNTGLNHLLEKSKSTDLLPWIKADLAAYAAVLAQDEYHLELVDKMKSFANIENIKNYHFGITKFSLPYYTDRQILFFFSSATNGSISTPWFGKKFSLNFINKVFYKYIFNFPQNFSELVDNGTLVLEIQVRTMEFTKEIEELRIFLPLGGQQRFCNQGICNTEKLHYEFKITDEFKYARPMEIHFLRNVDPFTMGLWENKTMTGFHMDWWVEDTDKNLKQLQDIPQYKNDNMNIIKFFDSINFANKALNVSLKTIWNVVKEVKRDSIDDKEGYMDCSEGQLAIYSAEYLINTEIRKNLNLQDDTNIVADNKITDEEYEEYYQMFLYLVACPTKENILTGYEWRAFYEKLFNPAARHSTRTIAQVVAHNMNMKIRRGQTNNLIEQSLIRKMNKENIHSKIGEIGLSFLISGHATNEFKTGYSDQLEKCISSFNCTEIDEILLRLDDSSLSRMIHHPVHIIDKDGNFTESSFIPFCALAGNMEILGKQVENFKFPVCTKFKPKYLFGDLCYQIDVNDVKDKVQVTNGVMGGITFALDYNEDRRISDRSQQKAQLKRDQKGLGDYEAIADQRFKARIYIECIEPYTGGGDGKFMLNSVKEIVGTSAYAVLASTSGICQTEESVADCFEREYVQQMPSTCNCSDKRVDLLNPITYLCRENLIENITLQCKGKLAQCFGVSADISHVKVNTTIDRNTEGFERLVADYEKYRLGYQVEEFNVKDHFSNALKDFKPEVKLHYVNIFFASPTFDQIKSDQRATFETKLSAIGGTVGLFAGVSILSVIEFCYYALRIFLEKILYK